MKKILFLFAFLLAFAVITTAQTIVKGTGVLYTNGVPNLVATQSADAEIAIDTTSGLWYEYNRDALAWSAAGFRIQLRNACTTPTHTPGDKQSYVLLDTCDNLYRYRNGTWTQINSGGGGGATDLGYSGTSSPITLTSSTGNDVTITQGGIVTVTASGSNMTVSATETDGSVTNEGQLGVGAGGANTATITTNTSGGNAVTVSGGGILAVTESTSSNGGTITLTATEVDGSLSNEGTLGVGAGGASSSTIISNTSGATGVTINVAGINAITESTSSNGGSITITATEVDGSTTNELQTIANTSDATSHTATLSNSGGSVKLSEGSGITMATTGTSSDGVVTITASDPSPTNEIQQLTNSSDATNHYLVLDSGGSLTLAEGANITLTTTGTGDDGIVTIAATGSGAVANNGVSDNEDSGKIRLGNRYMNGPDAPFTMDRKLNLDANKLYIGDNTDSTLLQIDGTNDRVGIGTTTPGRKLTVNGEVEIKDLVTTSATVIVGADGNGVLSEISVGSGLDLTAGVLTATGGGGGGSTDLSYTGTNSPITLNSSTGTDVTITEGGIVDITATGTNMTITAAEVDGSVTNEGSLTVGAGTGSTSLIVSNTSGSTDITITAAGILTTSEAGNVITLTATEVDGSVTNEGQLGVGAGAGNTSTITTNTSGGNPVTIQVAGINTISETTGANGGTIVITGTEVDGSTTNEAWTIDGDDADTEVISNQTVKFAGAGIITTDYVPGSDQLTITGTEVDGSVSNEGSLTVGAGAANTSLINSNTSGSTAVTITAAGILTTAEAGNVITLTATEVDGSVSNEGQLGVGAGGASSSTITTNTSGGNAVTINVGGINAITESTSANGGSITITATEVDGSTTNELQTITNTSNATSHTVTLSNTGGSVQLAEGSNITLTTTGTGADGVVTIAATSTADGNGIYSGSGTVPSVPTATITNQLTFLRATDDGGGLVPVRVQVDAGNEPDFMSFRNGSDSLRIKKGDQEFELTSNKTISVTSSELVTLVADSVSVQTVPNAVENERTLLMLTPANTIAKSEGLDPDIINQNGASAGQVLEWNGSKWAPATDDSGGGGFYQTMKEDGASETQRAALNFIDGGIVTFTLTDDGANNETEVTSSIVANSLTANEIAANAIETSELNALAVTNAKVNDVSVSKLTNGTTTTGLTFTSANSSNINFNYNAGQVGIQIDDSGSAVGMYSEDNTQYVYADNTSVQVGSGTTQMQYIDGVLRQYDSDITNYVGIKTPATGSLTANYTLTLPVDDGTADQLLKTDGSGNLSWTTVTPGGTGDINQGGNAFGIDINIGSNDNFAVSLEQNNTRFLTGGTDKNVTLLNSVAATAATTDRLKINTNSTGTAANGFGGAILFNAESSTTDDQELARITGYWGTATHASREGIIGFQLGDNGGALAEIAKFDRNTATGRLTVGSTTPIEVTNGGISANTNFILQTGTSTMTFNRSPATTNSPVSFIFGVASTGTAANGFGNRFELEAETSTNAVQDAAYIDAVWTDATNATRTSDFVVQTVNSATIGEAFRIYGNKRAMVGGGTNQASAAFQINSTTGGFLCPRVTNAEMLAIATPAEGLEVYNTTVKGKCVFNGTDWERISCAQTPSVTAGTGAGTGATVSVVGDDFSGVISITCGTSPAANEIVVTLDFHTDFDQVPYSVELSAANEAAVTMLYLAGGNRVWHALDTDITVADFDIKSGSAANTAANGTTYKIYYQVKQ